MARRIHDLRARPSIRGLWWREVWGRSGREADLRERRGAVVPSRLMLICSLVVGAVSGVEAAARTAAGFAGAARE
jgi:hypothetical protein